MDTVWPRFSFGYSPFTFLIAVSNIYPTLCPACTDLGNPWQLPCLCHIGHRQHRGPPAPTWCVLMEWRSATVQSTSGSGEPEPLQVMTAFSPSRTVRFTWLTLISGRSRRSRHRGAQVWSSVCYNQLQGAHMWTQILPSCFPKSASRTPG